MYFVSKVLRNSLAALAAAAVIAGCADEAMLSPDDQPEFGARFANAPDLGACQNLQAPATSKLALRVYAEGVQIYRWSGTSWTFVAPDAALYANAGGNGQVGTHYAGPTWESNSGSKVVGRVLDRCTPDPTAIAWLLLEATSSEGPGIFKRVTLIQRVNTVGGLAPVQPGSAIGEEARVAYTTEYFFYRND
jgi:FtsP/CotA-like multicopper oxidase with cupredoxin domain